MSLKEAKEELVSISLKHNFEIVSDDISVSEKKNESSNDSFNDSINRRSNWLSRVHMCGKHNK